VHDVELLNLPATVVDVFVTNAAFSGKTLRELAEEPFARGVYLRKITRQGLEMPILPESEVFRGDILTLAGGVRHVNAAVEALGVADRPLESTDLMTVAGGILLGGLVGALSVNWRGVPIGLSTSGGVLVAGLLLGYLRTLRPTFGRIPAPALVLMNSLGLNAFIAIVGINAGPGFVTGVQQVGLTLFLWGAVATTLPLLFAVLLGHHVFKFHPAILFGACAGVRTTTAALGMIQDAAKSKVPALGYGMPYAIGNTLLTIFGMAIVLLTSR
jgi:putative transport protein